VNAAPLANQLELLVGIDRESNERGIRAFGQRISVGVLLGIGLGSDFRVGKALPDQQAESNSGIYGVSMEAPLTDSFAIEVDGVYRALHGSEPEFNRRVRFAHLTWEFPVLLKYRFGKSWWRPMVEGGSSFGSEGNLNLQSVSHYGGTLGAGVEFRVWKSWIAPTVRYTRWAGSASLARSATWANQTHALLSIRF